MIERLKDRLALVGCANMEEDVPYLDEDIEKWVLGSKFYKLCESVDYGEFRMLNARIFDIHTMHTRTKGYLEFIKGVVGYEIIMQEEYSFIKQPIKYPIAEVLETYGSRYFLCSFSYMVALAMFLGYKEIYLYGVSMMFGDDYLQKYNFEYWLGRAEQLGIKIQTTDKCDILKCGALYGYEADNTLAIYQNRYKEDIKARINLHLSMIAGAINSILALQPILENEQGIFMQTILDRHKINAKITHQEEWGKEEC